MATRNVVYVGTYLPESLQQAHDWSTHSPAGRTQQQSTITALSHANYQVDVLANMIPIDGEIGWVTKQQAGDNDVQVYIPPSIKVIPTSGPPRLLALLRKIQFKLILPLIGILYLCSLTRRKNYEAIVFYNFNIITAFPALIAGKLFQVPIIIDFNDSRLDSRNWLDRLRDKTYLYAVDPWIDGGICINTNMTSLLRTENTAVVRGEPSVKIANNSEVVRDKKDTLTVIYGGKFDDIRGIDILLKAAPEIVEGNNIEVRIAGYGPRFEEVQQRISEMDTDRVTFLGNLTSDQYREELLSADIALNLQLPDAPGNKYTFPTKILDYLATGNIVISTRMSDLETVLDDILVFTDPTSEELAPTVRAVCDDISAHSERVDSGLAWVRENCSQEKRVDTISGLVDEVCS